MAKKPQTNETAGVAIESLNYSNTIIIVAIEGTSTTTICLSLQQRVPPIATSMITVAIEATSSNQIFFVAIEGSTYNNHIDSVAIERSPVATKYLSWQ